MPELLRERCGVTILRRSFRCPNPAHDDREPSAKYYEDGNTVHCFGCGKTWDVFELVGMLDGIDSYPDQARAVADTVGYRLDGGEASAPRKRMRRSAQKPKPPFEPPRTAGAGNVVDRCTAAYRRLWTPEGDVGRRYLHWRGLDDADIARYGLGFVLKPTEVMDEFSWYEPEALGFVVIPFYDEEFGEARYCMARTVSRGKVVNKEWRPKGVVSPLWREWLLTSSQPVVYVTEGLIDAMALEKQIGRPTVALGGVANASRLASVLYHAPAEKRPGKIVIAMDEDDEGCKAAAKIAHDLDVIGVAHAMLPPYPDGAKDADEWLMNGRGTRWEYEREPIPGHDELTPYTRTRWVDAHGR